jgi:hypothetical protein
MKTIYTERREESNRREPKAHEYREKALFPLLFARCSLLIVLCIVLAACPVEPEHIKGDIELSLPITSTGAHDRHYYSLSTGEEVTNPSGDNWDLALDSHDSAFFILTNSGDTAAETSPPSSGKGGVWYTGSPDCDAVTRADQRVIPAAGSDDEPYTQDVYRWTLVMAAEPIRQNLNVMTYLGYPDTAAGYPKTGNGSGLDEDNCFRRVDTPTGMTPDYVPYLFNKRQAYRMGGGMPPEYTPTGQVYIVRHGDGKHYSKVQLSEAYRESGIGNRSSLFVMQVRHAVVD